MSHPVLETALRLNKAGLSCIPIRGDGSKAPCIAWKEYQDRLPTEAEIYCWWAGAESRGIALVCGSISGNVECLDFDSVEAYDEWRALVECDRFYLASLLCVTATPGPGRQVWYRCEGPPPGNHVLAKDEQGQVLIETRGAGGYALIPPSPGTCHPNRKPYALLDGDLADLPPLAEGGRDLLHEYAQSLNRWVSPVDTVGESNLWTVCPYNPESRRVGDRYNEGGDHQQLLERHGWRLLRRTGEGEYWQRPGKKGVGISGTWNVVPDHFYVFSSNAAPLVNGKAYDKFGLFCQLEAEGDFRQATKLLVEQGYGRGDGLSRGGVNNAPDTVYLHVRDQPILRQRVAAEDFSRVVEVTEEEMGAKPPRFPLLPLSQILSLPPTQWLIQDMFMEQSFCQIYGPPGSAKSFLTLDLALSIVYNREYWFGKPIRRHGPVIWINADGGRGMSKRVQAWVNSKAGGGQGSSITHPFLTLMGAVRLNRPEEMLPFRQQLAAMSPRPVLVVVDTLSRCTPGADENSQQEMAGMVGLCDLLREEVGCSLLLIHHTGRSGERDRGSSVIPGALDTQIRVSLDEYSRTGTARCEKSRDGDRFRPFQFQLTPCGNSCIVTDPEDRRAQRAPGFTRIDPYA